MKYEKTCSQGSFVVWGTGFRFDYEASKRLLNIAPTDKKRALAQLKFDKHLAKNPLGYVESLDKTQKINALMYSNNATINLADTLDHDRISGLMKTTALISRLAFDLNSNKFERFSRVFCEQFDLKSLKIKKFASKNSGSELFLGRIQTQHNNSVCVRSRTLSGLAAGLSDRTLRDLITMEFGHSYNNSAHNLLNASSKLSTISHVIDDNFIPEHKLNRLKDIKSSTKTRLTSHKNRA